MTASMQCYKKSPENSFPTLNFLTPLFNLPDLRSIHPSRKASFPSSITGTTSLGTSDRISKFFLSCERVCIGVNGVSGVGGRRRTADGSGYRVGNLKPEEWASIWIGRLLCFPLERI